MSALLTREPALLLSLSRSNHPPARKALHHLEASVSHLIAPAPVRLEAVPTRLRIRITHGASRSRDAEVLPPGSLFSLN